MDMTSSSIVTTIDILKQRFGDQLSTAMSVRQHHSHTTTQIKSQLPDAVIFAKSTDDVAAVAAVCRDHQCPIIPFGVGSSLEGHVNAPKGGISIDMNAMDRVLAVHEADLDAVVQPGVTRESLNNYLRDTGLFFPIDPGANASLGGMAATRASGTNAVRYGTMKDNILALEAVMADGRVIRTGTRAKKSSAGYDLTRLLIGSEGTLGLITELTVKLHGIPEVIAGGICSFPSVEAACNAVITTIQYGIPVARIELLDAVQVVPAISILGWICLKAPCYFWNFMALNAACANSQKCLARLRLITPLMHSIGPLIKKSEQNCGKPGMTRFGRRWRWCPAGLVCLPMYVCLSHVWQNVLKTPAVISRRVASLRRLLDMLAMAIFILCRWLSQMMRQRGHVSRHLPSGCLNAPLRWVGPVLASMALVRARSIILDRKWARRWM